MKRKTIRINLCVVISALIVIFVGGCGGGGGGGSAPVPLATSHAVTVNWNAARESGVNSLGGGYQVSISGQPTVKVPFTSGATAPTTTKTSLLTGVYTVTVRAYAALDATGGNTGSLSPGQSITVTVP